MNARFHKPGVVSTANARCQKPMPLAGPYLPLDAELRQDTLFGRALGAENLPRIGGRAIK